MSPDSGKNNVSELDICTSLSKSVLSFPGIISMEEDSAGKARDILSRDITVFDGIRLTKKNDGPIIDVFVVVEFGTQIPKLAWELQKQIESDIMTLTGKGPKEVNIHIEGVSSKEHIHEQAKS